jgi:uncharacterized Zn finger protein
MTTHHDDDRLVQPADACPKCGERDMDNLVWDDDENVRCATCGTVYDPMQRHREGGSHDHA